MAGNPAIDDRPIESARRTRGRVAKRGTAASALSGSARRRRQRRLIKLFGTIDFDPAFDYKTERLRKRR